MAPKTKFIRIGLYNPGSLNTGQDDFLVAMDRFKADIVAINETWLGEGQEACAPAPPGYKLRCIPRPLHMKDGRGGGVGFYVKNDIKVRYLKTSNDSVEQLWLTTRANGYSLVIGTAYRTDWIPVDTFIDVMTDSVSKFSHYDYLVLLGDFNINMVATSDIKTKRMSQFLRCFDLQQVVSELTHFTSVSATLIDLVCTNCKVRDVQVTNITGKEEGHSMINVTLTLRKAKVAPRNIIYRPLKDIDMDLFNNDLCSIDWERVIRQPTIDAMVSDFNYLILGLFDRHAPVKSIRVRDCHSLPWITDNIKYMIDLRNEARERQRQSNSEIHKQYYKDLKSLVEKSIYNEKRAYFNHCINSNLKDSKKFWHNLKDKILINPSKNDYLPDCFNDPDLVNDHFLDIPGNDTVTISDILSYEFNTFSASTLTLQPVDELTVSKYIMSIKSNAMGSDNISREMIILTLPRTLAVITIIVNGSIASGVVPHQWKEAIVNPLSKVDQPNELKDLRPISILPFLSKVLEKAVYYQLSSYIENNNILPSLQSGFRKGRGTVTALLDVTDNVLAAQDDGLGTILTLLDFSRAFDSIDIPLLISKLSYYGLDYQSVRWFSNYLSNRIQSVKLRKSDGTNLISEPKIVTRGVPQGSILGPLLFIIYSADLARDIRHCNFHLYADDVQLYISVDPNNIIPAINNLNKDLDSIAEWSRRHALILNPNKSKFMILGSKQQIAKIRNKSPAVSVLGQSIENVDEAKNLGVMLDRELRFESHVESLVRNCFFRLKVLYKIRNLLSEEARIRVCESLVLSRLNYADLVYGPRLLYKTKRLIQRVQNACCRYCFNVPPRSHITPFLNNASMLNMESRRKLHLASLMFDVFNFKSPDYLFAKLKFPRNGELRTLRPPLEVHRHKTVAFTGSFRYSATKCWNNIPPPIRKLKSKHTFKIKIKTFLFEKQKLESQHRSKKRKTKKK